MIDVLNVMETAGSTICWTAVVVVVVVAEELAMGMVLNDHEVDEMKDGSMIAIVTTTATVSAVRYVNVMEVGMLIETGTVNVALCEIAASRNENGTVIDDGIEAMTATTTTSKIVVDVVDHGISDVGEVAVATGTEFPLPFCVVCVSVLESMI
jgi:hypothetical protein